MIVVMTKQFPVRLILLQHIVDCEIKFSLMSVQHLMNVRREKKFYSINLRASIYATNIDALCVSAAAAVAATTTNTVAVAYIH